MRFDYALVERWFEKTHLNIARRQLITKDRYDRTVNNFFPEEAHCSIIANMHFSSFAITTLCM